MVTAHDTPESVLALRDLVNRLRGRYARGPIMADGRPEFGYVIYEKVPAIPDADGMMGRPGIYEEAAKAIETLLAAPQDAVAVRASLVRLVLVAFPDDGMAYCLNTISSDAGLPREVVRATLRSLVDDRLVTYHRGLWSEDGERPAGSGYSLTKKGSAARSALVAPPQPPAPEPSQGDAVAVRRAALVLAEAVRPEVLDRRSTVQVAQALAAWDALALPPTDAACSRCGFPNPDAEGSDLCNLCAVAVAMREDDEPLTPGPDSQEPAHG